MPIVCIFFISIYTNNNRRRKGCIRILAIFANTFNSLLGLFSLNTFLIFWKTIISKQIVLVFFVSTLNRDDLCKNFCIDGTHIKSTNRLFYFYIRKYYFHNFKPLPSLVILETFSLISCIFFSSCLSYRSLIEAKAESFASMRTKQKE